MRICIPLLLLFIHLFVVGQNKETIGLLHYDDRVADGYSLITPLFYNASYLVDNCGKAVHQWSLEYRPGPTYLMPDGSLLTSGWDTESQFKIGGVTGYLQKYDWNNNLQWSVKISDHQMSLHHDFYVMENGNILAMVWEKKTEGEILKAGRDPQSFTSEILAEKIVEIKPVSPNDYEIVWEWSVWDHLVQDRNQDLDNYGAIHENKGLLDINYVSDLASGRDWVHFNSIDYNEKENLILLSARHFNEIWVIDHSTTIHEAKGNAGGKYGKGGDILFRWGNPRTYTTYDKQQFFGQHDARWINKNIDGLRIMVFNNGFNRLPLQSSVDIIAPVTDDLGNFQSNDQGLFLPEGREAFFTKNSSSFYSSITSGAQLLNNGKNLLVTLGSTGHCYEFDLASGEKLWEYVSPVTGSGPQPQGTQVVSPDPTLSNTLFKMIKYDEQYFDFTLPLGSKPVELYDLIDMCNITNLDQHPLEKKLNVTITYDMLRVSARNGSTIIEMKLFDLTGKLLSESYNNNLELESISSGIFLLTVIDASGEIYTEKIWIHKP